MTNTRRILVAVLSVLFTAAGCAVQPLHSTNVADAKFQADVAINPVDSRLEQQVRSRLIFLLNGGEAEPVDPRFVATLSVVSKSVELLNVQRSSTDSDTTATSLTITGTLELTDSTDEDLTKTFARVARASYDKTTQYFANSRAQIDAEDRAAQELAEELRNLVIVYIKSR